MGRLHRGWAGIVAAAGAFAAALVLVAPAHASAPVLPGCEPALLQANAAGLPAAIPDGPAAGLEKTLPIGSTDEQIVDVDVSVRIAHSFPGDIELFLESPAGTEVTLTTDNGAANDDVFRGTVFDDQADPGSGNTVTDHVYQNAVVVPRLAPEEPLSALDGQNPSGTWKLRVADDDGGATGTIEAWSLAITTGGDRGFPATSPLSGSNGTEVLVPDNDPAGATSTIGVAGTGRIWSVRIATTLGKDEPEDFDVTLTSPAGTVQTITTDNGGQLEDVFEGTSWTPLAGASNPPGPVTDTTFAAMVVETPLAPEESGEVFKGESPTGTWTLKVVDDTAGDPGRIRGWTLMIQEGRCPTADLDVAMRAAPAQVTRGGTAAYVATVRNGGSREAEGARVTAALPAGATLLAALPTQGACTGASCALGTLPVGSSAQVVYVVRLARDGPARVRATATWATDRNPTDDTTTATTQVVAPPGGGPSPAGTGDDPPVLVVLTGGAPKLRAALRRGLKATIGCTEACSLAGELRLDARTAKRLKVPRVVGRGKAATQSAGAAKLRVRFTRRARRRLRRARRVRLTLQVTATDAAGQSKTERSRVTLKR